MPQELPLACSLPPDALARRQDDLARLFSEAVIRSERRDGELVLALRPQARRQVEEAIRLEQECCPFLDFELRDGEPLVLVIGAPAEAQPMLDEFAALAV